MYYFHYENSKNSNLHKPIPSATHRPATRKECPFGISLTSLRPKKKKELATKCVRDASVGALKTFSDALVVPEVSTWLACHQKSDCAVLASQEVMVI